MPLITWKSSYDIGIPSIDLQHRKLADIINDLHDAFTEGRSRNILSTIQERLIDYTIYHFQSEEKLLAQYKYDDLDSQRASHDAFIKRMSGFKARFISGEESLSIEMIKFLVDWLINHILKSDKAYTGLLISRGVK